MVDIKYLPLAFLFWIKYNQYINRCCSYHVFLFLIQVGLTKRNLTYNMLQDQLKSSNKYSLQAFEGCKTMRSLKKKKNTAKMVGIGFFAL